MTRIQLAKLAQLQKKVYYEAIMEEMPTSMTKSKFAYEVGFDDGVRVATINAFKLILELREELQQLREIK